MRWCEAIGRGTWESGGYGICVAAGGVTRRLTAMVMTTMPVAAGGVGCVLQVWGELTSTAQARVLKLIVSHLNLLFLSAEWVLRVRHG